MKKFLFLLFLLIVVMPPLLYLAGIIYIVDDREYAVKTSLGKVSGIIQDQPLRIGLKVPLFHTLEKYPAKLQSFTVPPEPVVTKDKKKLIVDNFFKWRIDSVVLFRNAVGNVKTANNRLASIVHDAVKDVIGNTDLSDIIAREQELLLKKALEIADAQARRIGIQIADIRFQKVQLPQSNMLRLFERMKSERYREAAYYRSQGREDSIRIIAHTDREIKVLEAGAYREAQVIRGEADARAAEIYAEAFSRDEEFYSFWRTLEAYRKTIDTATTLVISPKSELYKFLTNP